MGNQGGRGGFRADPYNLFVCWCVKVPDFLARRRKVSCVLEAYFSYRCCVCFASETMRLSRVSKDRDLRLLLLLLRLLRVTLAWETAASLQAS
jgi:hypothetical protein